MLDDLLTRDEAEALAGDILALDGVDGLHGGRYGEVALLYPKARVRGLKMTSPRDGGPTRLEVHVTADAAAMPNLYELAKTIRNTAAGYTDAPVDVTFGDIADTL